MATIEPYETASGKRYMVRYRKPDNRQTKRRGFRTKRDAEAFAATVEVAKLTGTYVAPAAGRRTIDELGEEWFKRHGGRIKPSGARAMESAWRVHVKPRWGTVKVADIAATDVQAWISELSTAPKTGRRTETGLGASVIETCFTVLVGILDDAETDRRIVSNPLRKRVELPRRNPRVNKYLTHLQVEALSREAKYEDIILTLAYCGMRWGELAGIRVRHVNFLKRRISLEENAVTVGTRVKIGTLKGHSARSVSMPAFVADLLAERCRGKGRDDWLWTTATGTPLSPPASKDSWLSGAVGRCMNTDSTFPRITAHDLRHTYASLAVSAGANVKVIQKQLGHKSAAMTLDVYSDLFDTDQDSVAEAFETNRAQNVPTRALRAVE